MFTHPRRIAAAIVPLLGLSLLLPTASAHALATAAVDPTARANERDDYTGHVQVVPGPAADPQTLKGAVFVDYNRNSVKDPAEPGIPGVTVSNGRDVVTTDILGNYALPAFDRMTAFVTQPAGYAVPVNQDNIAQFSYNHFPNGSPALKFGGVAPTGPLPKAVNFPMVHSMAAGRVFQNCAVASDTQIYNMTQAAYARQGAVRDLVARHDIGGCGAMLLGDNVGDDLGLNPTLKDLYRQVHGPIRAIPGNHDMDYDAASDDIATDTFRAQFGPTYYSYDIAQTHHVALDDIEYNGAKAGGKNGGYKEFLNAAQIAWLKKDLAKVPAHKLVVIYTHSPFLDYRHVIVKNSPEVFEALKSVGRTAANTLMIGGHTHTLENLLPGTERAEYAAAGVASLPFHQIVSGTVSGDWYSGSLDEYGLPNAYGIDGQRPGHLNIALSGNKYAESYKIRQQPWSHRQSVGVNTPSWRDWAAKALTWRDSKDPNKGAIPASLDLNVVTEADLAGGQSFLTDNFYLGSREADVKVSIDGGAPQAAQHTQPGNGEALRNGWEFSDVVAATANLRATGNVTRSGSSLWRAALPTAMSRGTHTATFTATDRFGRVYTDSVRFLVVETPAAG